MSDFSDIGGIPVLGFISPVDTRDEYAVTDPLYAIGGFRILSGDVDTLNLIPESRRRAGMIVGINNGEKYYKLLDKVWDFTLDDWEVWSISESGDDDSNDFDFNGTHINGSRLVTNKLMQVSSDQNTLNVSLIDNNIIVNLKCLEDYNIILPPLNSVGLGFKITFKNLILDNIKGVIYPYNNDLIENSNFFNFFGKGLFQITKMTSLDGLSSEWVLTHYSNIIDRRLQGKTKKVDFINENLITVTHDLGYIPIVQVWQNDGLGGFSDVDVDVDHDYVNKDKFTIDFGETLSGFILFI